MHDMLSLLYILKLQSLYPETRWLKNSQAATVGRNMHTQTVHCKNFGHFSCIPFVWMTRKVQGVLTIWTVCSWKASLVLLTKILLGIRAHKSAFLSGAFFFIFNFILLENLLCWVGWNEECKRFRLYFNHTLVTSVALLLFVFTCKV